MYHILPAADFRLEFSQHLLRVMHTGERLLITRNGHDAAALVSVHDLDRLEKVDAHSEAMMEAQHRRMMADFRRLKEGGDGYS